MFWWSFFKGIGDRRAADPASTAPRLLRAFFVSELHVVRPFLAAVLPTREVAA